MTEKQKKEEYIFYKDMDVEKRQYFFFIFIFLPYNITFFLHVDLFFTCFY